MRALLGKTRTPLGVAVIAASLLAVGGTATAAVVTAGPDTSEVADVTTTVPTEPATPTAEVADPTTTAMTAPAAVDSPAAVPAADTPATTVSSVTEPTSAPAGETIPAPQVNPDGSLPGGWLPPQNPGEPPVAPYTPPTVEPLPGEPGYQG